MIVLSAIHELTSVPGPVVLAIGVFDGLHLGHRAVLQRAHVEATRLKGTAVPLTFDPHPARILRPEHAPLQLTATEHKTRLFASLGFSHTLVLPFLQELAATEPVNFVQALADAAQPMGAICVGYDWSFGKGRAGNLALLQALGNQLHFDAIGVDAVEYKDEPISSTRVRTCISNGHFECAAAMLGRPFTVLGVVHQGRQLGRTLGFPTANLTLFNEQLPPNGVYAVRILRENRVFPGVANLGTRPTVERETGAPKLEVHLLDFNADLYGETLEVEFVSFLRPEQQFVSLEELRAQIQRDARRAGEVLFSAAHGAYTKTLSETLD